MTLVAVNASQSFWERHGFEVVDPGALAEKLQSYEPDARLMIRRLV